MTSSGRTCRLYLITPPKIDDAFPAALEQALAAGDVACLQIRLKDSDDDAVRRAAATLMPICHRHDVAVIMNDRPDLAKQTGCDGAHVGQEDSSYAEARRILGPGATVGVTCKNSRDLAVEAAEAGADYVAFGGFFASTTKQGTGFRSSPELLTWWQENTTVPCVAIGGITVENCGALVAAGADFLAVISGVWDYPAGPAQAVRDFNRAIAAALEQPAPTAHPRSA